MMRPATFTGTRGFSNCSAVFSPKSARYLRHRMSKGELVGIGLLAQGFNIAQLLLPQLVNAIFK